MELLRRSDWFTYYEAPARDPKDAPERVEFQVRLVPESVRQNIEAKNLGRVVKIRTGGEQRMKRSQGRSLRLDKAVYALEDSRGVDHRIADAREAELFGRELKAPDLKVGDSVKLDGRWTDALRLFFLGESEPLLEWLEEKHTHLTLEADDDEAGKG